MLVYFAADTATVIDRATSLPDGVVIRPMSEADVPALAELYLRAYEPPVVATLDEAIVEMTGNLGGSWGDFWAEASPGAWIDGELVSAVHTVVRPSWAEAPDCPYLIEVLTSPQRRRAGLARALITVACGTIRAAGEDRVGLTVDRDNVPAVTLYTSMGFSEMP